MAIQFSGTGDGLSRTTGSFLAGNADFTYMFWTAEVTGYPTPGQYRNFHLIDDNGGAGAKYIGIYADAITGRIGVYGNDGVDFFNTVYADNILGNNYNIAITYDNTAKEIKFYVNKVLLDTITSVDLSAATFTREQMATDGVCWSDVVVSYYRSWQRKLSLSEIVTEASSPVAVSTTNLFCDTPLADTTDLADDSGNARNWAITGGLNYTAGMKQVIAGRLINTGTNGDYIFNTTLGASNRWKAYEMQNPLYWRTWPISASGTISNINLILLSDPTTLGVTSLTFDLYLNDVVVGSTVVTGAGTTGTIDGPFLVAAGDTIAWQMTPSPIFPTIITTGVCDVLTSYEFDSNIDGQSIYGGLGITYGDNTRVCNNAVFAFKDRFDAIIANACKNVISVKGNITRLDLTTQESPDSRHAGASLTFNIVVDGVVQDGSGGTVDTTMVLTTETEVTWTGTLPLDPATDDLIWWQVTPAGWGITNVLPVSGGVCFTADTNGEYWIGGFTYAPSNTATPYYNVPSNIYNSLQGWGAVEANKQLYGYQTGILVSNYRAWTGQFPNVGKSWLWSVVKNGVDVGVGGPTVTIADLDTIGTDTSGLSVQISPGDSWSVRIAPTNTPSVLVDGTSWAFVGQVIPVTANGNLIVTKVVVGGPSGVSFTVDVASGLVPASFSVTDGGSQAYLDIAPGTYSVIEQDDTDYLTTYDVDNADPNSAIVIGSGETVNVIITNTYNVITNPLSGIYKIIPNSFKSNDTVYLTLAPETTEDRAIPQPTFRLGLAGK